MASPTRATTDKTAATGAASEATAGTTRSADKTAATWTTAARGGSGGARPSAWSSEAVSCGVNRARDKRRHQEGGGEGWEKFAHDTIPFQRNHIRGDVAVRLRFSMRQFLIGDMNPA